ncbi:MAG: TetR/AcrR family transcriptional regulator, partial [Methylococcales bacterium]
MNTLNNNYNAIKHKQILAAATNLFLENGFTSTSMDLIAKTANVSKQTVYSHFGNKDTLFIEAIKDGCDSYQILDNMITETSSAEVILYGTAERFLQM